MLYGACALGLLWYALNELMDRHYKVRGRTFNIITALLWPVVAWLWSL